MTGEYQVARLGPNRMYRCSFPDSAGSDINKAANYGSQHRGVFVLGEKRIFYSMGSKKQMLLNRGVFRWFGIQVHCHMYAGIANGFPPPLFPKHMFCR